MLLAGFADCPAVTLDWNSVNWTAGNLSQSFDIDGSNAGNDITITISGDTGNLTNSLGGNTPPDDVTEIDGGTGQQALMLSADHSNLSQSLTVTITFLYSNGVNGLQFSIFDVDRSVSFGSGFDDQIRNFTVNGGTSTNVSITGSSLNTVSNNNSPTASVSGNNVSGDTTANANAAVSFQSGVNVYSISFDWGNQATFTNVNRQAIAIGDLTWTPAVPEPGVVVGGGLLGLLAGWHAWRRRASR